MNVTIHALLGLAEGIAFSRFLPEHDDDSLQLYQEDMPVLIFIFLTGILLHGVLDIIPHTYPIPAYVDIGIAALLFSVMLMIIRKRYFIIITAGYLGNIFPDIIDHGLNYAARFFGKRIPRLDVFPWHRMRRGNWWHIQPEFFTYGMIILVSALFVWAIIKNRKKVFRFTVIRKS